MHVIVNTPDGALQQRTWRWSSNLFIMRCKWRRLQAGEGGVGGGGLFHGTTDM